MLTDFLLARIAEDEKVARAATQGKWKLWGMTVMADQDGTGNVDTAVGVANTYGHDERGAPRTWNATHIARHDPARVLAECEAKRLLVARVTDVSWAGYAVRDFVLESLALPYADHPDFREEWRP